jgi:DNA polymerase-3 subunit delta
VKYDEIISDLKKKIYRPIYFLMGEESYYIDLISDYISKNVLPEAEKTFNQIVLYGKDTDVATIMNASRKFPMMSNYQVVIVREAQNLKNIDELAGYVEKPLKSTILVINYKYGTLDKRKKLTKLLAEHAVLFDSAKLYENQIPEWINKYLKDKNFEIEPSASAMLTEFLGTDLSKISNELDKLAIVVPSGTKKITPQHVEHNIGISKDYNNFELTKALGVKNTLKAYRIADYFAKNPKTNPFVVTVTALYGFFSKILLYHYLPDKSKFTAASALGVNPYFIAEYQEAAKKYPINKLAYIISCLREYDLKSKGIGNVSATDGELLKELIYKILH